MKQIWNGKDMKLNLKEMERNHAASTLLTWTLAKGALFGPGWSWALLARNGKE